MENVFTNTKWKLDPAHSELLFKVKHLMIANVKGEFQKFDAEINSQGNDFSNVKINATVDTSSIYTNNKDRDAHLKSKDFFDVENNNRLEFKSGQVKKVDADNFQLIGDLTIKGITNEVKLAVEFGGIMKDLSGNEKAGFSINGKINRKDWGLNWNAALDSGGVMVSEEVNISADLQFIKQA